MKIQTHAVVVLGMAACLAGCSDSPVGPLSSIDYPRSESDALLGADLVYSYFLATVGDFTMATGVLTDELTTTNIAALKMVDQRTLGDGAIRDSTTDTYLGLQRLRLMANGVVQGFLKYASQSATPSPTIRGQTYAIEGYTEVMLAELFCSGIPMSTVNLDNGRIEYKAAMPRDSIFRHAAALFDSALALSTGNDSLMTLARVGKGRALLGLGQFADAAQAVANVAEGDHYVIDQSFPALAVAIGANGSDAFTIDRVSDREGRVGLPYRSSHDPRTLSVPIPTKRTIYAPNKYLVFSVDPYGNYRQSNPFIMADWIEARLIQAEAALHANDVTTWLQTLNHLRATAPVVPPVGTDFDPPITLTPLADPGTSAARVDMMFSERAAWLYVTGHRQGDLRRLIRQYGRTQNDVYPNGPYTLGGTYGTDMTAPIPSSEKANPNFHGCIDRNA